VSDLFPPIVGFITDFGLKDSYVSEIHSTIMVLCPAVRIIDISHFLDPGDIDSAAYLLWRSKASMPRGTIFLAVVDPGVGSDRQAVVIENEGHYLVGPDNGVFSRIIQWERPVAVRVCGWEDVRSLRRSSTFHGRDLFAPLAARLANGAPLGSLGAPGALKATFPPPRPVRQGDEVIGRVVYIDRFGNLATDLPNGSLDEQCSMVALAGQTRIQHARNYIEAPPDRAVWIYGSDGCIEIAWKNRHAGVCLEAKSGEKVRASGLTASL